jgi:carboxymethylenebutenolidase
MLDVISDEVYLPVSDGTTMMAYTCRNTKSSMKAPAVIVFQEAFGLNGHIKGVVNRLAQEGYVAIAPALFHRTAPNDFIGDYNDFG